MTLRPSTLASTRDRYPIYSVFRSGCIVSCGCEVVCAFGRGEGLDETADSGPEAFDRPLGRLAQERLQLGEGVLDRVEVGRVRRQVEQACAHCLDQRPHS